MLDADVELLEMRCVSQADMHRWLSALNMHSIQPDASRLQQEAMLAPSSDLLLSSVENKPKLRELAEVRVSCTRKQ